MYRERHYFPSQTKLKQQTLNVHSQNMTMHTVRTYVPTSSWIIYFCRQYVYTCSLLCIHVYRLRQPLANEATFILLCTYAPVELDLHTRTVLCSGHQVLTTCTPVLSKGYIVHHDDVITPILLYRYAQSR
jgi:hypothetical protein